jgi:hypothetical protein
MAPFEPHHFVRFGWMFLPGGESSRSGALFIKSNDPVHLPLGFGVSN